MEAKPLCCPVELSEGNNRIRMTSSSATESAEFYLIFLTMIKLKKICYIYHYHYLFIIIIIIIIIYRDLILISSKKTDIWNIH